MILSRGNLAVADVARVDGLPVALLEDGSTVGMARRAVIAVEPVPAEVRAQVPLTDGGRGTVALSPETVAEVARAVPRDKLFGGLLEHVEIHAAGDEVECVTTDGKRKHTMIVRPVRPLSVDETMRKALAGSRGVGVVLNRRRLIALLAALDKACSDAESGEGAVWLEVGEEGVRLRSVATRTGQRAVAYIVRAEGAPELSQSEWEKRWVG